MSLEAVREYLSKFGVQDRIRVFDESLATVELAAKALGVSPERIAKTISFKTPDGGALLVAAAGDVKIDNRKFKDRFGFKAKTLPASELEELVGHTAGGVCPFARKEGVPVYLDESLKRFSTVFSAAGSADSAVELTCGELFEFSAAKEWTDCCRLPESAENQSRSARF